MEKRKPKKKNKEYDIEKVKVTLAKIAKHNCKHCYGLGYIGTKQGEPDKLLFCRCALKKIQAERIRQAEEKAEARKGCP